MSLKQKTISGLTWSFIDNFSKQGITFVIGIILARLLTPKEFGLIGMITVFIAISESFINAGFGHALIRKKNCTDADLSTVFYFNLAAGILFTGILIITAPAISNFFDEPQIKDLVRVLALVLIIDAFTIIQQTTLTKRLDFKLQTKVSIISNIISGVLGISMAYTGFGVWSLVAKTLSQRGINSILLWLWNRWKPIFIFSKQSFNELFGFGSKLMISGLIDTIYRNVYYFIIGKFFSAQDLGYYTRADQFSSLPSKNLSSVIQRVSYPVLSSMQDDIPRLKSNYQKLIRSTMFLTFILMLGMAAVAEPMIITLIGEKWSSAVVYLQMLCFVGMFYPLHALNLNMLQVQGRSDLFLKLEIIKKILAVPVIIIGIFRGIEIMIAGMMMNTVISYYLNSYWSGRNIGYSMKDQIRDIFPSFALSMMMAVVGYLSGIILPFASLWKLFTQLAVGAGFIFTFCELTKFKDYIFVKETVIDKIKNR